MDLYVKVGIFVVALIAAAALSVRVRDGQFVPRPLGIIAGVIIVIIAAVVNAGSGQVQAGYQGVVLRLGAVTERTVPPGFYIVTPFLENVIPMNVQIRPLEARAQAASRDLQDVQTTVILNYRLEPSNVGIIYQDIGIAYESSIIAPAVQESVKAIAAQYDVADLIQKRAAVKGGIEETLRARLSQFGLTVNTVSITDFRFSEAFSTAIEAKQVAAQRAQEAENKLIQVRVEAQQAQALAEGQANAAVANANGQKIAAIAQAEGQAAAILTVAKAQSEANNLVSGTLTDSIIRYELVKQLGNDIRVVVLPSGQNFILGPEIVGAALDDSKK